MKTLIIPDLHQPQQLYIDAIEKLIADQKADQVVFLGDYFDRWNDTPNDALRTAEWLNESLCDPRRVHLIGNHDASYLWPVEATFCPGFTWEKEATVRAVLGIDAHIRFAFHVWIGEWLLTHAGLSARWVPDYLIGPVAGGVRVGEQLKKWLVAEEIGARSAFESDRPHWFAAVGHMRGGDRGSGGILWCDHRELQPVAGIRQLYGHTPHEKVRMSENAVCLDTNLGDGFGPRHYALIIAGQLTVHQLYR
jgi:hypothetical protein